MPAKTAVQSSSVATSWLPATTGLGPRRGRLERVIVVGRGGIEVGHGDGARGAGGGGP